MPSRCRGLFATCGTDDRRPAYGGHIGGTCIFIMVADALNLWGPTYFNHTFGYSPAEAGWVSGIIVILAGTRPD